jgi:hypothetical protein
MSGPQSLNDMIAALRRLAIARAEVKSAWSRFDLLMRLAKIERAS